MSSFRDVCDKLLRSPKPTRKADFLTENEYQQISSISHHQFLDENFNCLQLNKLCESEKNHLVLHYDYLERRVERNQKKIRKIYTTKRTVVKKKTTGSADVSARIRPSLDIEERHILATVEEVLTITEQEVIIEPPVLELPELRQDTENPTVPLAQIDLSQVMAPKELLKTDISPPVLMLMDPNSVDLDFGPAGDAGAFLGISEPMPISDRDVRDQVLKEFPSLRQVSGTDMFEDLGNDEIIGVQNPPLPVRPPSRLTTSTPVPSIRTSMLRQRAPVETSHLEAADVSDIPAGTPLVKPSYVPLHRAQPVNVDIPEGAQTCVESDQIMVAPENPQILVQQMDVDTEMQQEEPAHEQIVPPNNLPTLSSDSSTTLPAQAKRVPKLYRKARIFDDTFEKTFPLRTNYDFGFPDDFDMYDAGRKVIHDLLENRRVRHVRELPRENRRESNLRDVIVPQVELVSIQEPSTVRNIIDSTLEPPTIEGRDKLQLIDRTMPVAVEEAALQPQVPIVPTDLVSPEVALINTDQDPGLRLSSQTISLNIASQDKAQGDSRVGPQKDGTFNESQVPQVTISSVPAGKEHDKLPAEVALVNTGQDPGLGLESQTLFLNITNQGRSQKDGTINELPVPQFRIPSVPIRKKHDQPPKQAASSKDQKRLASMLKLYLTIQHEVACTQLNRIPLDRLMLLVGATGSKLACCRVFRDLLDLCRWSFLEIERDERSQIRSVSLEDSASGK